MLRLTFNFLNRILEIKMVSLLCRLFHGWDHRKGRDGIYSQYIPKEIFKKIMLFWEVVGNRKVKDGEGILLKLYIL